MPDEPYISTIFCDDFALHCNYNNLCFYFYFSKFTCTPCDLEQDDQFCEHQTTLPQNVDPYFVMRHCEALCKCVQYKALHSINTFYCLTVIIGRTCSENPFGCLVGMKYGLLFIINGRAPENACLDFS